MFTKLRNLINQKFDLKIFYKYMNRSLNIFFLILIIFLIIQNYEFIIFIQNLNPYLILSAFFLVITKIFIRSSHQRTLYKLENLNLNFIESLQIFISNQIGNNFFKFGTLYKISYLNNEHKLSTKKYFILNTINQILEILFLIIPFYYFFNFKSFLTSNYFLLIIILLLTIYFYFYTKNDFFKRLNLVFFKYLKSKYLYFLFLKLILVNIVNISIIYIIFLSLVSSVSYIDSALFYITSYIINLISLTPGNLGYFEFTQIKLEFFHNIDPSVVLAYSFVSRILNFIVLAVLYIPTIYLKKINI